MTTVTSVNRPTWGWLLVSSLWMLPVLGTIGTLSWVGFIIVGVTNRRSMWVWFGAGYLFLAVVLLFAEWGEWRGTLGLLLWAITLIHALVINPQQLRLRWSARAGGAVPVASRTGTAPSAAAAREPKKGRTWRRSNAAAVPTQAAGLLDSPGTDAGDYLAAASASPGKPPAGTRAEPEEVDPIDVNEASRRAFERLPGMNRSRASRAVKERDARDGFSSVEEFCRVLELQPHEVARLRKAVFCSPKLRTVRGVGRKLDL